MNKTATFWITTRCALLLPAFVVLGRIFDQDPKSLHNIHKLLGVATRDIASLSAAALETQDRARHDAERRRRLRPWYVRPHDGRRAGHARGRRPRRKICETRYREIRYMIFAHNSIARATADALMANTNVDEVRELLGFLHPLYQSLFQLHANGIIPNTTPVKFDLPPSPGGRKAGGVHFPREW